MVTKRVLVIDSPSWNAFTDPPTQDKGAYLQACLDGSLNIRKMYEFDSHIERLELEQVIEQCWQFGPWPNWQTQGGAGWSDWLS